MTSRHFVKIEKNIISEGLKLDFDIFIYSAANNKYEPYIKRNTTISFNDKAFVGMTKAIFVSKDRHADYMRFCKPKAKKSEKLLLLKFKNKSIAAYNNASKLLQDLFYNIDDFKDNSRSKEVATELVDTILDSYFNIKDLMLIATPDYFTQTHSVNVAVYTLALGSYIGLNKSDLNELGESALLHDIGKCRIDSAILEKIAPLTKEEFTIMKTHPEHGYKIAKKLGIKNKNILDGIKYHHEKMDGSGYPNALRSTYPSGIKTNQIPLNARIICLCDIFDALTCNRPYKSALSTFETLKLIKTKMKEEVDLELLDKMIKMFR